MEEVTLGQPIPRRIQTSINSHSERLPSPVLFAWAFVALRELEYAHCDASSGYSWEVSTMPITVTIKSMKEWFQHTVQSTLLVLSQVQPASVQSTVCHFLSFAHRNRTWICCSFRDFHLVLTRRNDEHRFGCCRRYIDVQEEDKTSSILDVWPILSLLSKRWTTPLTNGLETCLDRLRPSKSEGIVDDTRGIQQHWWEGNGSTQQGNHATRFQNLCVGSWGLFLFLTNWVPHSHGHAEFQHGRVIIPCFNTYIRSMLFWYWPSSLKVCRIHQIWILIRHMTTPKFMPSFQSRRNSSVQAFRHPCDPFLATCHRLTLACFLPFHGMILKMHGDKLIDMALHRHFPWHEG